MKTASLVDDPESELRHDPTNTKCPVCGAAELVNDTCDLPCTYKGETTAILAMTGDFCQACSESILDSVESGRLMQQMRTFSKQVNVAAEVWVSAQ